MDIINIILMFVLVMENVLEMIIVNAMKVGKDQNVEKRSQDTNVMAFGQTNELFVRVMENAQEQILVVVIEVGMEKDVMKINHLFNATVITKVIPMFVQVMEPVQVMIIVIVIKGGRVPNVGFVKAVIHVGEFQVINQLSVLAMGNV